MQMSARNPQALLLHGPGAEAEAEAVAAENLVVLEVRCEGGLRVDRAREVAQCLDVVPPGRAAGVVVVGPMDGSTPRATDALLKGAEELRGATSLLLWASDEVVVPPTLRSRCRSRYCPVGEAGGLEAQQRAREVVEAVVARQPWRLVELCRGADGRELALGMAEVAAAGDPVALGLWVRLRPLLVADRPCGRPRVLSALLGQGVG